MDVSRGLILDFPMDTPDDTKDMLILHMGTVHALAVKVCDEYLEKMRRYVYQTPKSFLSFLAFYKVTYGEKLRGAVQEGGEREPRAEEAGEGGGDAGGR